MHQIVRELSVLQGSNSEFYLTTLLCLTLPLLEQRKKEEAGKEIRHFHVLLFVERVAEFKTIITLLEASDLAPNHL